eukprot:Gb_31967 [translate_table: standard]
MKFSHRLPAAIPLLISIIILNANTAIATTDDSKIKYACNPKDTATRSYGFCNTSLPIRKRVEDLISRLNLREKVGQLSNGASEIARLGIPSYQWWSESLHGVAANGPGVNFNGTIKAATSFPQVILTAASFNETLWNDIAKAVAIEARAMYNLGQASLTFWAPNINIFRDPRWGRGQETPGEDPTLTSKYAVAYVRGFQGEDARMEPSQLMLSACCKHLTAYDLEKWMGYARYTFNAVVSQQDLEDTYQPPFKSCVEDGHASCMMCSYNQVNGVPACARYDLLSQTARFDWRFEGYITSDCDAVAIIHENQDYAPTTEDAVADVLKAGMDINCGTYLLRHTISAVQQGKVQESFIDQALFNLFSVQMRLGLFDGDPKHQRYGYLGPQHVCTDNHRQLALEAAREGIVLLKNRGNTLPLSKSEIVSLAVIGPNANAVATMIGDYPGIPCKPITPLLGLQNYITNISYCPGCHDVACSSNGSFGEAVNIASKADAVIMVVGLDLLQETEDHDRVNLTLPGEQQNLVSEVACASKGPVVLVLMCGGPVDVSFAKEEPRISSILWVGYPGEAGGQALAEVIFGDYNPEKLGMYEADFTRSTTFELNLLHDTELTLQNIAGGRLPMTWYPQAFTNIPMNDMNMRPNASTGYPGRTYRFYNGETVFPFGHGLSYSRYSYKFISTISTITLPIFPSDVHALSESLSYGQEATYHIYVDEYKACEKLKFPLQVCIHNHGSMDGSHIVQLFSRSPTTHRGAPQRQLIDFARVHIASGKSTEVQFVVSPCKHLSTVTEDRRKVLSIGVHTLMVGDTQLAIPLTTQNIN